MSNAQEILAAVVCPTATGASDRELRPDRRDSVVAEALVYQTAAGRRKGCPASWLATRASARQEKSGRGPCAECIRVECERLSGTGDDKIETVMSDVETLMHSTFAARRKSVPACALTRH